MLTDSVQYNFRDAELFRNTQVITDNTEYVIVLMGSVIIIRRGFWARV